jgi:hypothetical protein
MPETASRITRVELDAAREISAGSIRVQNILVANGTAGNIVVDFTDADATVILTMAVLAHESQEFGGDWIADNGLSVLTEGDADVVVTAIHSYEGA